MNTRLPGVAFISSVFASSGSNNASVNSWSVRSIPARFSASTALSPTGYGGHGLAGLSGHLLGGCMARLKEPRIERHASGPDHARSLAACEGRE